MADIEHSGVVEQKLMAMMHAKHPLARNGYAALKLREVAEYPVVLPNRDTGGRQLLERFLARSSTKMHAMVESNSFEFLRACLEDRQSISFQMAIGAESTTATSWRATSRIAGFRRGRWCWRDRGGRLPVIAYAFAEFLRKRLGELRDSQRDRQMRTV